MCDGHGEEIAHFCTKALKGLPEEPCIRVDTIDRRLSRINDRVLQVNRRLRGTGSSISSTIVAATSFPLPEKRKGLYFFWIGDSRLYRLRDGSLYLLSQDHSDVDKYITEGILNRDEADSRRFPRRLTRAIGNGPTLYMDCDITEVKPEDRYLLCSDGLSRFVIAERIGDILRMRISPRQACKCLLREALETGGADNVSAIVIDIP